MISGRALPSSMPRTVAVRRRTSARGPAVSSPAASCSAVSCSGAGGSSRLVSSWGCSLIGCSLLRDRGVGGQQQCRIGTLEAGDLPDPIQHHEAQQAGAGLLVPLHGVLELRPLPVTVGGGQAEGGQDTTVAVDVRLGELAGEVGDLGG